jgi:dihydroorotate dehydrogenase (NAD+) catalytic subunit
MSVKDLSTYDMEKDYCENLQEGPRFTGEIPSWNPKPTFPFLGHRLNSPLGIPAGLLLDSKWVGLYASLGFDILAYKTVRSHRYPSHPWPNCLFVKTDMIKPHDLPPQLVAPKDWEPPSSRRVTITNSFGMPSLDPTQWQEDVEKSLGLLKEGQVLIVSVVGTFQGSQEGLVEDFARVASMASEAGAPIIELNFSCPNTVEGEGTIYTDPPLAGWIAREVRKAVKGVPLFLKVGLLLGRELGTFIKAVAPWVQGIVGINSVPLPVVNKEGRPALGPDRETSGVCGWAIRQCGLSFVKEATAIKERERYDLAICGCGGIAKGGHVEAYLQHGVQGVFTCTGAMFNPYLALEYKRIVEAHENPAVPHLSCLKAALRGKSSR